MAAQEATPEPAALEQAALEQAALEPAALKQPPVECFLTPETPEARAQRLDLSQVSARLAALRSEMPGLAGPIALTAVGGGVAAVSAYLGAVLWMLTHSSNYDYDRQRSPGERRALLGLASLSLGGVAASLSGVLWTKQRMRVRLGFKPERDALSARRQQLLHEVRYGVSPQPQALGLTLRASF